MSAADKLQTSEEALGGKVPARHCAHETRASEDELSENVAPDDEAQCAWDFVGDTGLTPDAPRASDRTARGSRGEDVCVRAACVGGEEWSGRRYGLWFTPQRELTAICAASYGTPCLMRGGGLSQCVRPSVVGWNSRYRISCEG